MQIKKLAKVSIVIIIVFSVLFYLGNAQNGKNPHHLVILNNEAISTVESIERIDDKGNFYSIDYTADYYNPIVRLVPNILHLLRDKGCTIFSAVDKENKQYTYRNYDFAHFDDENNLTSLTTLVKCHPEDGYASLALADAYLLNKIGTKAYTGSLDDGKTDVSATIFLPWICIDGINEKGLVVSILFVDVKDGEKSVNQTDPEKPKAVTTELLRYMLDKCANVDEAIELAKQYNLVNTTGNDFHLFVSDQERSVVLEWRYNELTVVESDIATNFYLAYDDAEDVYYGDVLKEAWTGPAETKKEYHYGYGHGLERFKYVAEALDEKETITKEEGLNILKEVSQTYVEGELSQETHYSLVYNHEEASLDVYILKNYQKVYSFNFE